MTPTEAFLLGCLSGAVGLIVLVAVLVWWVVRPER